MKSLNNKKIRISEQNTLVFDSPTNNPQVIAKLIYGDCITLLDDGEKWKKVSDLRGKQGYIQSDSSFRVLEIDSLKQGIIFLLIIGFLIIIFGIGDSLFLAYSIPPFVFAFGLIGRGWMAFKIWNNGKVIDFLGLKNDNRKPTEKISAGDNYSQKVSFARKNGLLNLPLTILYLTPNNISFKTEKLIKDYYNDVSDILIKKVLEIDNKSEIAHSMGQFDGKGTHFLDIAVSLIYQFVLEIDMSVPNFIANGRTAIKINIFSKDENIIQEFAKIAAMVHNGDPIRNSKWEFVEKLFGISMDQANQTWSKYLKV